MAEPGARPGPDDLERIGLYDPSAADAERRLRMLNLLLERGATPEEIAEVWSAYGWHGLTTMYVDLAMRNPGDRLSLDEAAARTGRDPAELARMWRAFGFPDPTSVEKPFLASEVDVLGTLSEAIIAVVGEDIAFQLARVIGGSMARIAHAEVSALRMQFEVPRRQAGADDVEIAVQNAEMAAAMVPMAAQVLDVVHRRHLVDAGYRTWSTDEHMTAATAQMTVGFADLVGFTRRSARLTPTQLAGVVSEFEDRVAVCVSDHGGRVVKLIGDEAMFVADDPSGAVRIGIDLADRFHDADDLPDVRVGLASGSVITMHGDYYGDTVNLASRLTGAARPATVVTDRSTRDAVALFGEFAFRALRPLELKGLGRNVRAYRVRALQRDAGSA